MTPDEIKAAIAKNESIIESGCSQEMADQAKHHIRQLETELDDLPDKWSLGNLAEDPEHQADDSDPAADQSGLEEADPGSDDE